MALKKPDDLVMDDGCHIVSRLQVNHPLFQGIQEDFKRAGFKPLVVEQVKNYKLWKKYNNEKADEFDGEYNSIIFVIMLTIFLSNSFLISKKIFFNVRRRGELSQNVYLN